MAGCKTDFVCTPSDYSQERDKRLLKVVHSIEVLLQVNLVTILSILNRGRLGDMGWGWGGGNFLAIQVNKLIYDIIRTKRHQNVHKVTL